MNQDQINSILARYPAEKPNVFNYQQAREDVLDLANALARYTYATMMINDCDRCIINIDKVAVSDGRSGDF